MDGHDSSSSVLLVTLQTPSTRSASPMTPSPSRDLRGVRLFRAISRKLGRRSHENLSYTGEDDSRSSSTDSCSSTSAGRSSRAKKNTTSCSSGGSEFQSNHISSSSSETGSDTHNSKEVSSTSHRHRHHHSTTAISFRKVFANLTLNTRSQSCSDKEAKRRTKKPAPKRILRPPVTYTYVKGISGLPTQRIPRTTQGPYLPGNGCNCGHQYYSSMTRY